MRDIAIIGAGELGGAIAHRLAREHAAETIRLVDDGGRVAEGKALDLMQAAPIEGFSTKISGATDLVAAGGADAIVIADRMGAGEWQGEEALRLLDQLIGIARNAVVIAAGSSQRDLIDRGVRERRLDRRRLFGTAPEALVAGARAIIGLALDASPLDVSVSILGNPPAHTVVPWESASLNGFALTGVLDEPTRRRLDAKITALWPPGPLALAAAAVKTIAAMAGLTRSTISCFVAPEADRHRTRTVALPVRVSSRGIEEVVMPSLTAVDRVALDNAMLL